MKRILLASASVVAFAGAAAAEVTFGGSATLGYNDEVEHGFFWETDLTVNFRQELNNGLVAGASFTLNVNDENEDDGFNGSEEVTVDGDVLLSLTVDEVGGLFFGDTAYAAETHWDPAGTMAADGFSEQGDETVLRGDVTYGGVEASVSYNVADADGDAADDLDQLSIGASGNVSNFTFSVAYQEASDAEDLGTGCFEVGVPDGDCDDPGEEETDNGSELPEFDGEYNHDDDDDFNGDEIFGVSVGTTFGGADLQFAYATNRTDETSSIGLEASYPFGPVTLTGSYVFEDSEAGDVEDSWKVAADYASGPVAVSAFYESEVGEEDFGVEGSFDVGNGLTVYAGYIDSTEGYVGGEYDLGNGAEIIVSFAQQDEEGAREYKEGTTVAVSMSF